MWYTFNFFDVFDQSDSNLQIFENLQIVKDIYEFVNLNKSCTVFTYGQTGSGKTYTLFGNAPEVLKKDISCKDANFESISARLFKDGIAQIALKNIFHCIHTSIEMGVIKQFPRLELQL